MLRQWMHPRRSRGRLRGAAIGADLDDAIAEANGARWLRRSIRDGHGPNFLHGEVVECLHLDGTTTVFTDQRILVGRMRGVIRPRWQWEEFPYGDVRSCTTGIEASGMEGMRHKFDGVELVFDDGTTLGLLCERRDGGSRRARHIQKLVLAHSPSAHDGACDAWPRGDRSPSSGSPRGRDGSGWWLELPDPAFLASADQIGKIAIATATDPRLAVRYILYLVGEQGPVANANDGFLSQPASRFLGRLLGHLAQELPVDEFIQIADHVVTAFRSWPPPTDRNSGADYWRPIGDLVERVYEIRDEAPDAAREIILRAYAGGPPGAHLFIVDERPWSWARL